MKVAIFGDKFMPPRLFIDALESAAGKKFGFTTAELDWPDVPFADGRGVKEFVGNPDLLVDLMVNASIVITHMGPVTKAMLKRAKNLKLIACARGGPVNVDVEAARANDIQVINTPGRNSISVAEYTLGLILAETRSIARGHQFLSQGKWRGDLYRLDRTGGELGTLTVGIIGYGHISRLVAKLLSSFESRVLAYDPYVCDEPGGHVTFVGLEETLARSDIVTLHARLTPETKGLIGAREITMMKDGAYLINTARGELIDHDALYEALSNGNLRGAALDTFVPEPPATDSPLLSLPNVTVTPHIAGASVQSAERAAHAIASDVKRFIAGEQPLNAFPTDSQND